jgi:hypothetical protein
MAYKTLGRQSVTLQQGVFAASKAPSLNALAVVAHGWRSPARGAVCRAPASGPWITPLCRWTRPLRRAA